MAKLNTRYTDILNNNDGILWDLWLSRQYLPALVVADKVNIFECINNGAYNINAVASSLKLKKRGIEALIYFLVSVGLLNYKDNKISLTKTAINYLLPNSSYYWGHAFTQTQNTEDYKRLFIAITNTSAQPYSNYIEKNITHMWKTGYIDPEMAETFTKVMHSTISSSALLAVSSNAFNGISHLLDIGGGSGCFSVAFTNCYSKSSATIFELPAVCSIIANQICNSQIKLKSGNFFVDDFPHGCDGILLSNILHDWEVEVGELLLEKSFKTLPHGGKIFIHEMLLDEDKCGPKTATAFNLLMYVNHGSQQFTKSELYLLLEKIGFKVCNYVKNHPYYSLIVAQK